MPASAPGRGALELRGVTKRYGTGQGGQVTAAEAVTFTIEAGAFAALTGASGSGKSTMLHMIGAIERPTPAPSSATAPRSPRCAATPWPTTGAPSASSSSATTCCPP